MDLDQIQGAWRVMRIERGGAALPDDVAMILRVFVEGDAITLMEGDRQAGAGVVRLDPTAAPRAFDLTATEGPREGTTALGIYRVSGDSLAVCLGPQRPARFVGEGDAALIELERIQ